MTYPRLASTQTLGVLGHGLVGMLIEGEVEDGVVALELGLAVAVGGVVIVFLSLGVCPRHGVRSRAGQWPRVALHACVVRVQKHLVPGCLVGMSR